MTARRPPRPRIRKRAEETVDSISKLSPSEWRSRGVRTLGPRHPREGPTSGETRRWVRDILLPRCLETPSHRPRYGAGQLLAVPAQRKDGATFSIEFSIQLLRDATERWKRWKELRLRLKELERAKPSDPGRG